MAVKTKSNGFEKYNRKRSKAIYHGEMKPPKEKILRKKTAQDLSRIKNAKVGRFKVAEEKMIRDYLIKNKKMIYLFDDDVKHFSILEDANIDKYFINTEKDNDKWITLGNLLAIKGLYDPETKTEFKFKLDKRWGEERVMEYFAMQLDRQHPDVRVGGFGMLETNFQKGARNCIRVFIKISHVVANIDIILNKKQYEYPSSR